ncbi:MAG: hypothetical protein NTV57_04730 [Cyanobacteria bacterium]|nr:hypothetical protein [Cyanobacteriota bacterium]
MTALLDRLVGVFSRFQSREADLRRQLADALADDAADEAAIAAARKDALAAIERAATAEALMVQLKASAEDASSQLSAIGTYLDQFVPALTTVEEETSDAVVEAVTTKPVAEVVVATAGELDATADDNSGSVNPIANPANDPPAAA